MAQVPRIPVYNQVVVYSSQNLTVGAPFALPALTHDLKILQIEDTSGCRINVQMNATGSSTQTLFTMGRGGGTYQVTLNTGNVLYLNAVDATSGSVINQGDIIITGYY